MSERVVESILAAYRRGLFPMADARTGRVEWFSPDPRAIIPLWPEDGGEFHVSRSLARRVRSGKFAVRCDTAFEGVVRGCGEGRPDRPESWIDERIVVAYTRLHAAGDAHSVEAWLPGPAGASGEERLVGGVYGVSIGGAFFAESMFCRPELGGTDASKVCLVHLVRHVRERGYLLLDVQFRNRHTDQFGTVEVRRREYLARLRRAVAAEVGWGEFGATHAAGGS